MIDIIVRYFNFVDIIGWTQEVKFFLTGVTVDSDRAFRRTDF